MDLEKKRKINLLLLQESFAFQFRVVKWMFAISSGNISRVQS